MVSNRAKLDRRNKQRTQFGVSASNGSRDMARTKSRRKKRKKLKKKNNKANWMVSNRAKLDRRNKQHTQFGVSASNGSRDMARTKSRRKKKEKKNEREQSHIASPTGIANNNNKNNKNNSNSNKSIMIIKIITTTTATTSTTTTTTTTTTTATIKKTVLSKYWKLIFHRKRRISKPEKQSFYVRIGTKKMIQEKPKIQLDI